MKISLHRTALAGAIALVVAGFAGCNSSNSDPINDALDFLAASINGFPGPADETVVNYTGTTEEQTALYKAVDAQDSPALGFLGIAAAATDEEKAQAITTGVVATKNSPVVLDAIGFNVLARSGDQIGDGTFGLIVDQNGDPVQEEDGSNFVSNSNDFVSLLPTEAGLFSVSHFESRPAGLYLTELEQDENGFLTATNTRVLNEIAAQGGGWVHCAGAVTPWGSHMASEEYEPEERARNDVDGTIDDYYNAMCDYFGGDCLQTTPYNYGWPVEVTVTDFDNVDVEKRYATGRIAHELDYVMPDQKTMYMTDDGTDVGLFAFVADEAGDLTAGTLYGAVWTQTSAENGGAADLSWVDLGHATEAEIAQHLANDIVFEDMFNRQEPAAAEPFCADGFTSVHTTRGHECLQVIDGMEVPASRFETRRYAAMMGVTTEFRKMEGFTFNPETGKAYLAMSAVERGMEDGSDNDIGGPNHIRLAENKCGVVYELNIDDDFMATDMTGLVVGTPIEDDENNSCDLDGIANPDNVTMIPEYATLIIGEDTGSGHQNDVIWSYNLGNGEMTRILSTPFGSETTSPYWFSDINGFGYLMAVIQHPYGESDEDKSTGADAERGYTGYVGPFIKR